MLNGFLSACQIYIKLDWIKEKKVLRWSDTLGYIFMFETYNSEKNTFFCPKNAIFNFFSDFFFKEH